MTINNYEIKKIEKCLIKLGYKISSFNATFYYENGKKFFGDVYSLYFSKNHLIFEISKHRDSSFIFKKVPLSGYGEVIHETFEVNDLIYFLKKYNYDV